MSKQKSKKEKEKIRCGVDNKPVQSSMFSGIRVLSSSSPLFVVEKGSVFPAGLLLKLNKMEMDFRALPHSAINLPFVTAGSSFHYGSFFFCVFRTFYYCLSFSALLWNYFYSSIITLEIKLYVN